MSRAASVRWRPVGCALGAALLASGCSPTTVPLSSHPYDLDSGRALARTIADQAKCGDLEDYSLTATDHWDFTCQFGADMFWIHTADSAVSRDAGVPGIHGTALPYRSGEFFLVSSFETPGGNVSPDALSPFPGDLIAP